MLLWKMNTVKKMYDMSAFSSELESANGYFDGYKDGAMWAKKMLEPRIMFMGQYVDELNEEEKEVFDLYVRNNPDSLLRIK